MSSIVTTMRRRGRRTSRLTAGCTMTMSTFTNSTCAGGWALAFTLITSAVLGVALWAEADARLDGADVWASLDQEVVLLAYPPTLY